jgi:peptidyl-prolyl cis-trans isomerase B (cyclophilin B)
VTPKNRERVYEKRRYEEWQERLATKRARRQKARQTATIVGVALSAVAVIGGVAILALSNGDDDKASTASPATSPSPAAPSPSASASAAVKSACPAVNVQPPASPKQFAKAPSAAAAEGKKWTFNIRTTCGTVAVELDGKKAPQAVSSMLFLAKSGYFDGTSCHRLVTTGIYVLQCGDPTASGSGGPGYSFGPVENAPKGDLYKAGTVAMARQGGKADSMGSQFFLVYKDSTIPSDAAGGYTVLGNITKGLNVVKKVADGGIAGGSTDGAPVNAVSIASTSVSAG